MRLRKLITSKKFWCCIVALPFLLVGCASVAVSMLPRFDSDDVAVRRTMTAKGEALYQISYLESGTAMGQPVILVHGTPGDASAWYDFMKDAPDGFHFYAPDRPGFGQTRPGDAQPSLTEQARVLEPFVNLPSPRKPILVGHSLGGPIVAAAATLYGDRIGGIVIVAGALDPDLEEVMLIQHIGDTPPISWLVAREFHNSNRELIELEGELRALKPHLKDIKVPVTILHGTKDELVPYANTDFMMQEFAGTHPRLVTLEGVDHFLPWNSADKILAALREMSGMNKAPPDTVAAAN